MIFENKLTNENYRFFLIRNFLIFLPKHFQFSTQRIAFDDSARPSNPNLVIATIQCNTKMIHFKISLLNTVNYKIVLKGKHFAKLNFDFLTRLEMCDFRFIPLRLNNTKFLSPHLCLQLQWNVIPSKYFDITVGVTRNLYFSLVNVLRFKHLSLSKKERLSCNLLHDWSCFLFVL
jgi:hypothetical protein